MPKIIWCEISPMPKTLFDKMPVVTAKFDSGETKELFSYYPDELSFTAGEFIGLTEQEAHALRTKKDIEFLQS